MRKVQRANGDAGYLVVVDALLEHLESKIVLACGDMHVRKQQPTRLQSKKRLSHKGFKAQAGNTKSTSSSSASLRVHGIFCKRLRWLRALGACLAIMHARDKPNNPVTLSFYIRQQYVNRNHTSTHVSHTSASTSSEKVCMAASTAALLPLTLSCA